MRYEAITPKSLAEKLYLGELAPKIEWEQNAPALDTLTSRGWPLAHISNIIENKLKGLRLTRGPIYVGLFGYDDLLTVVSVSETSRKHCLESARVSAWDIDKPLSKYSRGAKEWQSEDNYFIICIAA